MHSFFASGGRIIGEEAAHLQRVLRLAPGDEIEVIENGGRALARLVRVEKAFADYEIVRALPDHESACRVTLYQGVCKGEKMDWIVQKCTEMGVHAVVPVWMERSVSRPAADKAARQAERLARIAREAVKQCKRSRVPEIRPAMGFDQALLGMQKHELFLMPYEEGGRPLSTAVAQRDVGILIGPEGGIAPGEAQAVLSMGGKAVTLGSRILRTETAGLVALTLVLHLSGDLEGEPV